MISAYYCSRLQLLGVLAHVETEKNAVEALVQIERLFNEMQMLKSEVEDLEYKLDARAQGVKSPQEIQIQLNAELSKR